jgi:hypothetical protein
MKTDSNFAQRLLVAAFFLISLAGSASQLSFTDTWQDKGVGSVNLGFSVATTGSFSANISLPLNGVDLSEADAGTMFTLAIGPSGNTTQIISDSLGDAATFSTAGKSAKFLLTDQNSGNTVGSVTVKWTASTISVSASATEDFLAEEQMFAADSGGFPTNSTLNSAVTGTFYEVSITLDASDNGGGIFNYDNQYVTTTGNDRETEFNPPDGSGPYPLESGSITGAGDFAPPKLTITSPSAGFKVYDANPVVDLMGTASDSEGIANIQCYVNGDTNDTIDIDQSSDLPTNHLSWTAEVDLSQSGHPGSNIVSVIAQDLSGNQTIVSRLFLWIETNSAAISVNPPGSGTVKGIINNQILQVGNAYKVTATPANKTWLFSEWTDASADVLSSNATFEYTDTDGTLIANFVTNEFNGTPLAGTYTGLFFDSNVGVNPSDAGYIVLTVTETGGYSAKLYVATVATPFSFSGQLALAPDDSVAYINTKIKANKTDYLVVQIQVPTDTNLADSGAGVLGGSVIAFSDAAETDQIDSATIQGELALYNTNIVSGLYNFAIDPASADPSQAPGGWSYGSATVSKKGAVTTVLHLADGISPAITFSSLASIDGTCPIYASLYGGNGVILGWMQFATEGSGGFKTNSINWVKFAAPSKFYQGGFGENLQMFGGLYHTPKPGTNVFGWTSGTFISDQGYAGLTLPDKTDVPVTYNPAKNTFSDTEHVTITFTPSTGALSGSFSPAYKFTGVEINGAGYGFYSSQAVKETGPIWVGPQ